MIKLPLDCLRWRGYICVEVLRELGGDKKPIHRSRIIPFVPTWFVSIGALLLSEQLDWDFYIPRMVTKSILFGGLLLAWAVVAWRKRMLQTADARVSP
jgi:hypothetical protein